MFPPGTNILGLRNIWTYPEEDFSFFHACKCNHCPSWKATCLTCANCEQMSCDHSRVDVLVVAMKQCERLQLHHRHPIQWHRDCQDMNNTLLTEAFTSSKDTIWSLVFIILYQTLCKAIQHLDNMLAVLTSSVIVLCTCSWSQPIYTKNEASTVHLCVIYAYSCDL